MNSLKLRWIAFAIGVVATLGIPVSAIWSHYQTLATGEVVKFRLAPVDPYDPFRGRYVALRLENNRVPAAEPDSLADSRRGSAYLSFDTDENGFALPIALHQEPPAGAHYLKVYNVWEAIPGEFSYQLPFDRYYLNEKDASLAEDIARDSLRARRDETEPEQLPSYLVLRVLQGNAAIEALMIDDVPVEQRVREEQAKK